MSWSSTACDPSDAMSSNHLNVGKPRDIVQLRIVSDLYIASWWSKVDFGWLKGSYHGKHSRPLKTMTVSKIPKSLWWQLYSWCFTVFLNVRAGRIYNYGRLRLKAFLGRDRTYCGFCNHKTESCHYQHMSSANWPSTLPMDPYLQPHIPCKNASSKLNLWYISYMLLITSTSSRHEFPLTQPFFGTPFCAYSL